MNVLKLCLVALWVLSVSGFAHAKTPSTVIDPYRKYVTALEEGNVDEAGKYAERAYDAGLSALERSDPMIGILAHNLADLLYDDPDQQIKLYRQAIALTPVSNPDDVLVLAQRWVALGKAHALRDRVRETDFKSAKNDIYKGWAFVEENALEATTFGGEMMVLLGWVAASDDKVDEALVWFEKADVVFKSPNHEYFSVLEYMNKVLRGKTLIAYDRDIEGAIVLQDVMQNLEGQLPVEHPYISDAFHTWLWARSKIEMAGDTEKAEAEGVCKCWPYDEMSINAPIPTMRMPPIMPQNAKRSGSVLLRFDVTREGKPHNIEILGQTDEVFGRPSVRSVKQWTYEFDDEIKDEDLQGITTTIRFRLTDERGNLLPPAPMKMLIEPAP